MPIKDPTVIVFAVPENKMDQIVDIIPGSISVGPGVTDAFGFVTRTNANFTGPTHDNSLYFIKGLWSADNGASWQKFGENIDVGDSANGRRQLTLSVSNFTEDMTSTNGSGQYSVDVGNDGASGYTLLYKILFIARPDQNNVSTKSLIQPLRYSSKENYLKIAFEGVASLPTSGSLPPIPHNLGYVPNVNANELIVDLTDSNVNNGFMFSASGVVTVDSTNIYISPNSHSTSVNLRKVYYRGYLRA